MPASTPVTVSSQMETSVRNAGSILPATPARERRRPRARVPRFRVAAAGVPGAAGATPSLTSFARCARNRLPLSSPALIAGSTSMSATSRCYGLAAWQSVLPDRCACVGHRAAVVSADRLGARACAVALASDLSAPSVPAAASLRQRCRSRRRPHRGGRRSEAAPVVARRARVLGRNAEPSRRRMGAMSALASDMNMDALLSGRWRPRGRTSLGPSASMLLREDSTGSTQVSKYLPAIRQPR
jgi:hypothetical protein